MLFTTTVSLLTTVTLARGHKFAVLPPVLLPRLDPRIAILLSVNSIHARKLKAQADLFSAREDFRPTRSTFPSASSIAVLALSSTLAAPRRMLASSVASLYPALH